MYAFILILHLIICLALIAVVLVQSGKGGGLAGGAFGGSAQTVFGGRGATDIVTRATMVLGGLFFVTSLTLALMTTGVRGTGGSKSLIQEEARKAASAPAQPGAPGQPSGAPQQGVPQQGAPAPAGQSAPPAGGQTAPPVGGKGAGTAPAPKTPSSGGR
jgi:preprotein translocase subunit SecG